VASSIDLPLKELAMADLPPRRSKAKRVSYAEQLEAESSDGGENDDDDQDGEYAPPASPKGQDEDRQLEEEFETSLSTTHDTPTPSTTALFIEALMGLLAMTQVSEPV
jgi:hypothetical protein